MIRFRGRRKNIPHHLKILKEIENKAKMNGKFIFLK